MSTFLGEQCRKYRKILGITQEELAEKMNTTPQTISNYERMGIKDVDVENEISSILGVDLSEETEENGLADLVREVCCLNM
ncbi:helix-turn-helix domain-containing protein [Pseudobutyrivibrio ruminis]|nr:helix-turn-helix transcriptional regulator [Pseudobutyrivibrio ruminis]